MKKKNNVPKVGKGGKRKTIFSKKNNLRPKLACFWCGETKIELRLECALAYLTEEGANLL